MSQPIPTTSKEIANAISDLRDFYEGAWAGCGIPFDWNPLTDGIREFLDQHLADELPEEIEREFLNENTTEVLLREYPVLIHKIQQTMFATDTLGSFLKKHFQAIVYSPTSQAIPTSPNEVANAIKWLTNLHAANLEGIESRFIFTDGIREFLSEYLLEPSASSIEQVLECDGTTEKIITVFPALIERIQQSSFEPDTLGFFLKERTKNIEYTQAHERLKVFIASKNSPTAQ